MRFLVVGARSSDWKCQMRRCLMVLLAIYEVSAADGQMSADIESRQPQPKMPTMTQPVMFDTAEADHILSALQVFPPDNPWNEDVSARPVAANSREMIASIGAGKPLRFNLDMCFILVPPNQPRVPVKITQYPQESDAGDYPVPDNAPIEEWPLALAKQDRNQSLIEVQRRGTGDRHMLVVDPTNRRLFEFWIGRKTDTGWQAAQASVFDLTSNKLRPDGWTSADAAGLPIFPAVVRYDELERGMVDHALRVTVRHTRRGYVYPATHFASSEMNPNLPRMGERLRLRQDFDLADFSPQAQAILKGLKKHGMLVADNGMDWSISVAPDQRIHGLEDLRRVRGSDFEVIVTTGPDDGPRTK